MYTLVATDEDVFSAYEDTFKCCGILPPNAPERVDVSFENTCYNWDNNTPLGCECNSVEDENCLSVVEFSLRYPGNKCNLNAYSDGIYRNIE